MRIIPAIDIINGECVRLTEGDFATKRAYGDPVSAARRFAAAGASRLHVVDLEGAKEGRVVNWKSLSAILALDSIEVQAGGGVRTAEDASRLLGLGAKRIVVGSIAIRSPHLFEEWIKQFGPESFCVAVDVKHGVLVSQAWLVQEPVPLAEVVNRVKDLGVQTLLCTDVMRDGKLAGPNVDLYRQLVGEFPSLRWIASGGVRSRDDLMELQKTKVYGVVLGKALHDGTLDASDLAEFLC
ncbi:MAG: 1-(5-phosphoribosyl)-5-[(5-phosphoribosylamino)methylideneamino]imidazole-4-carboxamide isomerase [Acidobacteriota bacterium]